jgi:hypothetical protein
MNFQKFLQQLQIAPKASHWRNGEEIMAQF